MSAVHCFICLNHVSLDSEKFAIFPCGHGFCTTCITRLFLEPRPKCPNCRVTLHRGDAHPVFVEIVDPQIFLETSFVDGLNRMGSDTPLVSVQKAGQKLGKILEGSKIGGNNPSLLVNALEDFKERITPIFAKVETQTRDITKLNEDLRRLRRDKELLQSKLKKIEPLQGKVSQLKRELSETERNTAEALRLAEVAKDEVAAHHTTTNQWKKRATELELENKRYKDMLERQANAARLQKEKTRKLGKQVALLTNKIAKEEKESMSTTSHIGQDYYGGLSTYEHTKVRNNFQILSGAPSRPRHCSFQDENDTELNIEAMPPPNFPSDWQIEGNGVLRKRNLNGGIAPGHRRVANPFPIALDRKGHPTRAVQMGPKSIIHIGQ